MRELASRGKIELDAVFEYVINGLNDNSSNKIILYGAKSVGEFKDKLKDYEKMRGASDKKSQNSFKEKQNKQEATDKIGKTIKTTDARYFNCGSKGHRSKECKHKNLASKCFKCNEFGHIATNCKKDVQKSSPKTNVINMVNVEKKSEPLKEIKIENVKVVAFIDMGSAISLIRENELPNFQTCKLQDLSLALGGFGGMF